MFYARALFDRMLCGEFAGSAGEFIKSTVWTVVVITVFVQITVPF
jgi:hypothetical protein